MCSCIKDVKHCDNVKTIWRHLNSVIHFGTQWKHVIFGFYFERNVQTQILNTNLSFEQYFFSFNIRK